jgi:Na+/phosphate symporter
MGKAPEGFNSIKLIEPHIEFKKDTCIWDRKEPARKPKDAKPNFPKKRRIKGIRTSIPMCLVISKDLHKRIQEESISRSGLRKKILTINDIIREELERIFPKEPEDYALLDKSNTEEMLEFYGLTDEFQKNNQKDFDKQEEKMQDIV